MLNANDDNGNGLVLEENETRTRNATGEPTVAAAIPQGPV